MSFWLYTMFGKHPEHYRLSFEEEISNLSNF